MTVSSTQFRLLRKAKDPKFNIDDLEHYNLMLQAGFSDIQLCITDSRKNRILLIEDYVMPGVTNQVESVECLDCLFDDHHLLLAGFWNKIKVLVKNRRFSIVPKELFVEENTKDYIGINAPLDDHQHECFHNTYKGLSLVNAFAVSNQVISFIDKTYKSKQIQYFHQSSAFINGFNRYFDGKENTNVCLYLDRFVLHIAVFKKGKFKFYNQFPVKKFDDYIRYADYVINELSINVEKDKFYVWGYLGSKSNHFKILRKKYPTLKFGERPAGLKLGYVFDEIPEHQYFDLLSFNFLSKKS
ncbi:MAG: DUF3822 family protein [Cyclobacteriaceae bacterium]